MKINLNTISSQIILQSVRAVASIALVGGIAVFFIHNGTGVLGQSIDILSSAKDILAGFVV